MMRDENIVNIFTRYFNSISIDLKDLLMIFLYYARKRTINILRAMLLFFKYRDSLALTFEVPPLISLRVLRCIKKLINDGLINISSGDIVLSDTGYRYVSDLLKRIYKCNYVIVGSLVRRSSDFIREVSLSVSNIENSDVYYVLKSSIVSFIVDEFSGYDVVDLVRLVLSHIC
ncbi:MAG: hypothetical protein GXO23_04420 [Crenarchaeota archaeon]|nr:hypothetical protein [Thermoproteota archaeon]